MSSDKVSSHEVYDREVDNLEYRIFLLEERMHNQEIKQQENLINSKSKLLLLFRKFAWIAHRMKEVENQIYKVRRLH